MLVCFLIVIREVHHCGEISSRRGASHGKKRLEGTRIISCITLVARGVYFMTICFVYGNVRNRGRRREISTREMYFSSRSILDLNYLYLEFRFSIRAYLGHERRSFTFKQVFSIVNC